MDPYVKVTIGEEIKYTQVKWHNRNPSWDEQLVFHVRESDLSHPILLSVFDWDRISFDDHVGDATTLISELVKKDRTNEFYPDCLPTMREFNNIPLAMNPKRSYMSGATLTFFGGYQSYENLWKQVGY
ncbi:C2 domain-containing protein [Lactarius quietus]|nr:C2 domain-containing protein [Lactarius quietus]